MKVLTLIIVCFTCQFALAQNDLAKLLDKHNRHSVAYISAKELIGFKNTGKKYVLLDAREIQEYKTSYIPSAIYVGYNSFDSTQLETLNLDKNTATIVYCTLGIRSEDIGEKLVKMGFTQVYNLQGGIVSWKNNQQKIINTAGIATDTVHVYGKKWAKWLTNGTAIYD